jgi:hypothetical protein
MYLDGGMASKRTPGLGTVTAAILAHDGRVHFESRPGHLLP